MLLLLVCVGAEAGEKRDYDLKRHEVSLGIGFLPSRNIVSGYHYSFIPGNRMSYSLNSTYFDSMTNVVEIQNPYIGLNYFYNFNKYVALGGTFSYEGGSRSIYSHKDDSLMKRESKNILTAMANFRVSWLNRKYVRMYSLIGMGFSFSAEGDFDDSEHHYALQFSPLGISVGNKLYGFLEAGVGTSYLGCNFGIGYRF